MNVDEKGDLTGTKLLSESKAGWGAMLLRLVKELNSFPHRRTGNLLLGSSISRLITE